MKLNFVTGNSYKFEVLGKLFDKHGIELHQIDLDTPEIQAYELKEIAEYSARWAVEKVGEPLLVNDSGYFLPALNGFPGPFVKYACQQLRAEDWLQLLDKYEDRRLIVKTATTLISPGKQPITFERESYGSVSKIIGAEDAHSLNRLFIPDEYDEIFSNLSQAKQLEVWNRDLYLENDIQVIKNYINFK